MVILVGNDDGIESAGILELAKALSKLGKVVVCAPDKERSAAGHCISIGKKFRVEKRMLTEEIEGYSIDGSPRDCVEIGTFAILDKKPDLIVTGINKGPNLCSDMVCSGTVAAASVGLVAGVPAIAVSLGFSKEYDFSVAAEYALKAAEWFIKQPFNREFVLNINVPSCSKDQIKGVVTSGYGGHHDYKIAYDKEDGEGCSYYKLKNNGVTSVYHREDTSSDLYAFDNNYVVINAVDIDVIRYQCMDKVEELVKELK